ncbi:hypothetical protein SESBI_04197 [Sesbania bispinosa]|nr:hypothetical protein SESBI_04197 [Sesbania bispinosa]
MTKPDSGLSLTYIGYIPSSLEEESSIRRGATFPKNLSSSTKPALALTWVKHYLSLIVRGSKSLSCREVRKKHLLRLIPHRHLRLFLELIISLTAALSSLRCCVARRRFALWLSLTAPALCGSPSSGGSTQVRFQPRTGQLLVVASGSVVSLFDVETNRKMHTLQMDTL